MDFSIGQDVLDTRDLIEYLEELKTDFVNDYNAHIEGLNDELAGIENAEQNDEIDDFDDIDLDVVYNDNDLSSQHDEIEEIQAFHDELDGYGDFEHGEALIKREYFTEYSEDLVKDLGYIDSNLPAFISDNINWDGVADDLEVDYMSATIQGTEYLMRA